MNLSASNEYDYDFDDESAEARKKDNGQDIRRGDEESNEQENARYPPFLRPGRDESDDESDDDEQRDTWRDSRGATSTQLGKSFSITIITMIIDWLKVIV